MGTEKLEAQILEDHGIPPTEEIAKVAKFIAHLLINLPADLKEFITTTDEETQARSHAFMHYLRAGVEQEIIPKALAQQFWVLYVKHKKGMLKHGKSQ